MESIVIEIDDEYINRISEYIKNRGETIQSIMDNYLNQTDAKRYMDTMKILNAGQVMGLPDDVSGECKRFMTCQTITNQESPAYRVQQMATTDDRGYRRVAVEGLSEDAYVVALGTYYTGGESNAGDVFAVTLDNGTVFYCVTGDVKQDEHTDSNHQYRYAPDEGITEENADIIEFIVDGEDNPYIDSLNYYGLVNYVPGMEDMSGAVVEIRKLDMPSVIVDE